MKIFTTITLKDVYILESIFAKFTHEGWVFEPWLVALRKIVEDRGDVSQRQA